LHEENTDMPVYVRYRDLAGHGIPWSRPTVIGMVKEGKFPAPVPYGRRRTAWTLDDIERWKAAVAASRSPA
jgi:predicted DNA-binding transcriptional regulator AlpA